MSKVLDKAFLESVFPPERTEAFFDALFGGAEEGAYDIVLVCRSEGEGKAELAFELHQRPGKCLACNLTYGLPQVFQRHPILNVAGVARAVAEKLGWPIFVKPANAGSSVGISKARDMAELEAAVDLALQHDSRVVFERFVQGQEVECAVRGNDEVSGTHPGEILASAEFYTYDDKYISGTSRVAIPAQLAPEKLDEVRDLAVRAYRALCCKGLARVDFFVEHGTQRVLLNEVNTLPGFTSISMYPKLMLAAGETYPGLLDSLITLALERAGGVHD